MFFKKIKYVASGVGLFAMGSCASGVKDDSMQPGINFNLVPGSTSSAFSNSNRLKQDKDNSFSIDNKPTIYAGVMSKNNRHFVGFTSDLESHGVKYAYEMNPSKGTSVSCNLI